MAVTLHLVIEDCVQDCPFCRSVNSKMWACEGWDPSVILEGADMTHPIDPATIQCPFTMGYK